MTLEEGIEVIRQEMMLQSIKHRVSSVKRARKYETDKNVSILLESVRLEVTAEALNGIAKALNLKKVESWRELQKEASLYQRVNKDLSSDFKTVNELYNCSSSLQTAQDIFES